MNINMSKMVALDQNFKIQIQMWLRHYAKTWFS
jgi:hypothetical protein